MTNKELIKAPIVDELKKFNTYFSKTIKSDIRLLNLVTQYILKRKGKQMRPIFVFLCANLYGKTNESTYIGASLIELMHTATLIHDDVVDNANQRRGFFSINALWKNKIAVLMGDFLLSKGLLLAVKNQQYDILEIVSRAVEQMSEGELLQIEQTRKLKITESTYYEVIRKKTAVLLASCAAVGAQSQQVEKKEVETMWTMGEYLGMAFQIKDDLFDFEPNNKTGKPSGNDIQEKKLTLPLIYALNQADSSTQKKIRRMIKQKTKTAQDIQYITQFVQEKGGMDYAHQVMIQYKNKALDIINTFPDSEYKTAIISLIEYTISRTI